MMAVRWSAAHASLGVMLFWLGVLAAVGCSTNAERSVTRDGAAGNLSPGDTMRIHFERTGGFAGLRLTVDIETDTLSQEDQRRLQQLVEEADFFTLPAELRDTSTAKDQFVYRVTVEKAGMRHTVETTESAAGPLLQPLLEWLTRAARRRT
ncbi:MAG: hypothetical protein JSW71_17830 [Gemmatimonadota bacterium]|nr:MAG: hypothetical protein JSW71_17830 [Gemmatimonadota bacterium]